MTGLLAGLLACLLTGAPTIPGAAQDSDALLALARQQLEAGRPAAALELLGTAPASIAGSLLEVEVLYRGSDPRAARRRAFSVAETLPPESTDRTTLLWWATNASLWLQDPGGSSRLSAALTESVETADHGEARESWATAASNYAAQAEALVDAEQRRAAAVVRSRTIALGVLGAVGLLGLLTLLVRRRP